MSIINNVLKDLESRESQFTPIEINAIGVKPAPARDLKPLLLVALLLLLLMAGAWIYLQDQLISSGSSAAPSIASTTSAVAAPPVAEAEANQGVVTDRMIGNQIIGLQIRESEDDMRMEFVLRDKVVAFLKERGENSFGYHLRDIESQIFAPVISDNRWIRELAITSSSSGVDVNFQTAEDILVETRQSLVNGEPVWVINLRKTATSVVADTVVENIAVGEPAEIGEDRTQDADRDQLVHGRGQLVHRRGGGRMQGHADADLRQPDLGLAASTNAKIRREQLAVWAKAQRS